jgi:hypothetical protein
MGDSTTNVGKIIAQNMFNPESEPPNHVPKTAWTIMAYLAGDNNLAEEMVYAVRSMFDCGSLPEITIAVLQDSGGFPNVFAVPTSPSPSLTLLSMANAISKASPSVPVDDMLREFIVQAILASPAEHYMLILSGHGSGAVGDFLSNNTSQLSVPDLSKVLTMAREQIKEKDPNILRGKKKMLDILGLDSCLMSMTEVACQVSKDVAYMVGSEGFEANAGWPYGLYLDNLKAKKVPLDDPLAVAKMMVNDYINYYTDYTLADISADLSVLNLDLLDELKSAINPLADALTKGLSNPEIQNAILLAHWKSQAYKDEQYVDLYDLCELLGGYVGTKSPIGKACNNVIIAIRDIVKATGYCGAEFQYSHGVSIFFPWSDLQDATEVSDIKYYKKLDFAKQTRWDEFLREYLKKTRRDPRVENRNGKKVTSRLNQRLGVSSSQPVKYNAYIGSKYNAYIGSKYNAYIGSKYNAYIGSKSGIVCKIACMKNPAIDWYLP